MNALASEALRYTPSAPRRTVWRPCQGGAGLGDCGGDQRNRRGLGQQRPARAGESRSREAGQAQDRQFVRSQEFWLARAAQYEMSPSSLAIRVRVTLSPKHVGRSKFLGCGPNGEVYTLRKPRRRGLVPGGVYERKGSYGCC